VPLKVKHILSLEKTEDSTNHSAESRLSGDSYTSELCDNGCAQVK